MSICEVMLQALSFVSVSSTSLRIVQAPKSGKRHELSMLASWRLIATRFLLKEVRATSPYLRIYPRRSQSIESLLYMCKTLQVISSASTLSCFSMFFHNTFVVLFLLHTVCFPARFASFGQDVDRLMQRAARDVHRLRGVPWDKAPASVAMQHFPRAVRHGYNIERCICMFHIHWLALNYPAKSYIVIVTFIFLVHWGQNINRWGDKDCMS